MIAGNVYQLLPHISGLGRPRQATFDGTYIPPVRVEGVAVSTEN
jgi:predicted Zn-dependent protease